MKTTGQQYARDSSRSTLRRRPFIGLLCLCAVLTASAYAQQRSVSNFDDITTGWGVCTGVADANGNRCAGGSNDPTAWSQTFGNAPSLDDGSMLLSESGPKFSNTGWFYNAGASDTATSFTLDLQFNIAPNQNIQALEFDQFQFLKQPHGVTADTNLFFGTECDTGANWRVWDQYQKAWIDTHVACSYIVSSTAFNHLSIAVLRVAGDTSCGGTNPAFNGPCMYYTITLNGTVVVSNFTTNSGPLDPTFQEQTGLFIQLDTNQACGSACTISEYIDQGTFLASDFAAWWPAVQSLLAH